MNWCEALEKFFRNLFPYFHSSTNKYLVPIDGGLTSWSTWSTCTETCGTGTRSRTKTCTNPLPQNGGKDCTGLGDTQQQEDCNTQNCPGNVFQEIRE